MALSVPTDSQQLEGMLLRRSVGALEADRNSCADCGRTPLIGEQVHLYEGPTLELICSLCRERRRDPPAAVQVVRPSGHGHTVRRTARAA